MDPDLMLVIGLLVGAFSVPSIVGALADGRVPRVASIVVMIAGGLIVLALQDKPGGYTIEEIPNVFVSVVARFMN